MCVLNNIWSVQTKIILFWKTNMEEHKMFANICVCVYVYMYTHTYVYVYTYMYVCMYCL